MKREKVILIAAVILLLTAGNMFAQRGPAQWQDPPQGSRMLMGIPDLTEEQLDQIKDLQITHLKDIRPMKNDIKINNAILEALQTEDEPDMGKINELIEENGKLFTEIRKKQVSHKMEIRNLLTDDQKVFFDNKMHRMRKTFRNEYRGDGMRPFRGPGYHAGKSGI